MAKVLVVIGATGVQGGSVVSHFLSLSSERQSFRIRGLTREQSSAKAQELANKGVEIVAADLDNVPSVVKAFADASFIFSVTNLGSTSDPRNANKGKANGTSRNAWSYEYELQQRIVVY
jgi:uncharacterized protein YbjT (DUF2867 family)